MTTRVYENARNVHLLVEESWRADESCCVVDAEHPQAEQQARIASDYNGVSALITWTTGTTGFPKGVVIPWNAVQARCEALKTWWKPADIAPVTSFFVPNHSGGLITSRLSVRYAGGDFIEPYEAEDITCVTGTPKRACEMVTDTLQKYPGMFKRNQHSLCLIMTLHDRLTTDGRTVLEQNSNVRIAEMYGTSENGGVSIDGITLPGYAVRSVRDRLEVKSECNAIDYIGAQDHFPLTDDGFFCTPDSVSLSSAGEIVSVARYNNA